MKTDDPATRQGDEADSDDAKVVRLSDWLAPDEELVPFGPRAHAHARPPTNDPDERLTDPESDSAAASGFWDGDTSVHTAVPGPGLFDEPDDRPVHRRYRLLTLPIHPVDWGRRAREATADLVDRISWPGRVSWPWAVGGVALVALAVIAVVITLGGTASTPRGLAAEAGIGDQPRAALNSALVDTGSAARATAIADLKRLPPVNRGTRTIGAAAQRTRALQARPRHHVVVAPVSDTTSSTADSVETPTTTMAPTEAPTPTEPEPVQTTPTHTSPSDGGGSSSGGGSGSGSGSEKQPAFGASGSLGPGSSPNG